MSRSQTNSEWPISTAAPGDAPARAGAAARVAMKLPANKEPRRTVDVRRGWRGSLSLPPPGGNGLDCHNTIRSHETDALVMSAAIKCQAEAAGNRSACTHKQ